MQFKSLFDWNSPCNKYLPKLLTECVAPQTTLCCPGAHQTNYYNKKSEPSVKVCLLTPLARQNGVVRFYEKQHHIQLGATSIERESYTSLMVKGHSLTVSKITLTAKIKIDFGDFKMS